MICRCAPEQNQKKAFEKRNSHPAENCRVFQLNGIHFLEIYHCICRLIHSMMTFTT